MSNGATNQAKFAKLYFLASVAFLEAVLFQVRAYFGFPLMDALQQEI